MSRRRFRVNPHYMLPQRQGTPCQKQAGDLKLKGLRRDLNSKPLVCKRTLNDLAKLPE